MIEGISAETLLADQGHDTNAILSCAASAGIETVFPQRRTARNNVNAVNTSTNFVIWQKTASLSRNDGGIATRCAKTAGALTVAVQICCIAIWASIRA